MRITTPLLILSLLASGTVSAASTQHRRPSYLPPRTVKTIPTITRSAPTTTQPNPIHSGVNNPVAERTGAKTGSKYLIKERFHTTSIGGVANGLIHYSFLPGKVETMDNICIRAAQSEFLIDVDSRVFYFSGFQDVVRFGKGFFRVQQKFAEWKAVAVSNHVNKLDKEIASANFPQRMLVGGTAYKVTPHFVVTTRFPGTSMEKTCYYVDFRAVASDQFNVPLKDAETTTLFRFDEAGLAKFIELLSPKAAFEKLQALKNKEVSDKQKEELFQ